MRAVACALLVLAVLGIVLAGCGGGGGAGGSDVLRVGLIPNENPEEVEAQYEPLADYLSEELGREVEIVVPVDYSAVVEAMVSGELDLAYFGGLTYVQARERAEVHPLFTEVNPRTGTTKYRSLIIAPKGSPVREVADAEGRTFAFGGRLLDLGLAIPPSIMLQQAGVDYRTDLEEFTYTGGHDTTAQAVANGQVDAGGLEDRILYDLEEEGLVDKGRIRIVEESAPIEGYPWVVRDDLPQEDEEALVDAYLGMEDPDLLDLMRAEGYERVAASDYDYVEEQARKLGLLAGSS